MESHNRSKIFSKKYEIPTGFFRKAELCVTFSFQNFGLGTVFFIPEQGFGNKI